MTELLDALKEIEKAKLSPRQSLIANLLASLEEWERQSGERITWRDIVNGTAEV